MSVIIFGPTGSIASVAARTAQQHGATVFLAMRDTQKPIPGLNFEQEETGGFKRIHADLTIAASVVRAVKQSGAERAFIYRVNGTPDHMRATIVALKSAGIISVVFLSSYTVTGDPRDVVSSEIIPYLHARVEVNLDEIFGAENCVALRPGAFATNLLRFKKGIFNGEVTLYMPGFELDCITPIDIGRVAGTILAQGPRNRQRKLYLYGPQLISQYDALVLIARILGKCVTLVEIGEQDALKQHLQAGILKPVAEYMVQRSRKSGRSNLVHYDEGVRNVQLYNGKSVGFEEWVEANKGLFRV